MWMHGFPAIAFSLFLLTAGQVVAQETNEEALINIHSDVFSKERVESYGYKRFSIDASGNIRNGFRMSRGEPVDYSPLLNDEALAKDFVKTVLGCQNCQFAPFYWPEAILTYHFVVTEEAKTPFFFFKSGEEVYDVFSEGGLKAAPERQREKANLVVFVGDGEFLLRKAREIADQQVIRQYSSGRSDQAPGHSSEASIAQLFAGTNCAVSLNRRETEGRAYIFTPYEELEACLSKQLLLVAGLYPFSGEVPSALNLDLNYAEATLADVVFLRAYYYIRNSLNVADQDLQAASEWVFGAADFEKRMH